MEVKEVMSVRDVEWIDSRGFSDYLRVGDKEIWMGNDVII